jgi:hypothetical protein
MGDGVSVKLRATKMRRLGFEMGERAEMGVGFEIGERAEMG